MAILVRSLPCTAALNSSIRSGVIKRCALAGFIGADKSDSMVLGTSVSVEEDRMLFCRLIGWRGRRGGSIRLPCVCGAI